MSESEFVAGEDPPVDAPRQQSSLDPEVEAAGSPEVDAAGSPEVEAAGGPEPEAAEPEVEVVDGFPVLAEVRTIEPGSTGPLPAVQVAAVAATGFVAGAATVALVKRRTARKLARNGPRRAVDMLPIAATRSFLVDVHVIAKPD